MSAHSLAEAEVRWGVLLHSMAHDPAGKPGHVPVPASYYMPENWWRDSTRGRPRHARPTRASRVWKRLLLAAWLMLGYLHLGRRESTSITLMSRPRASAHYRASDYAGDDVRTRHRQR